MCKLANALMQEPVLKKIVSTAEYHTEPIVNAHINIDENISCSVLSDDKLYSPRRMSTLNEQNKKATYIWENTNKLLGVPGFVGLKTGITPAAGPCLAACYENKGHMIIVVILQSKSMEARWEEVPKLVNWAIARSKLFKTAN